MFLDSQTLRRIWRILKAVGPLAAFLLAGFVASELLISAEYRTDTNHCRVSRSACPATAKVNDMPANVNWAPSQPSWSDTPVWLPTWRNTHGMNTRGRMAVCPTKSR